MADSKYSNEKRQSRDAAPDISDDGELGYGRPPKRHRFKKGQSGNRRGRQKGDRNVIAMFREIAQEKVRLRLGDEVRIMRRAEAILHVNYAEACKNNSNAVANMLLLAEEARELVDVNDEKQIHHPLLVPSVQLSEEEFDLVFGGPIAEAKDDADSNND